MSSLTNSYDILQATFSYSFSCTQMAVIWIKLKKNVINGPIYNKSALTSNRRRAVTWDDDGLVYWHKYHSASMIELI